MSMEGDKLTSTADIIKLCGGLSLTEEEECEAVMDGKLKHIGEQKLKLCLFGKFIANKKINGEVFKNTIPKIWRTNQAFGIEFLSNNSFAFHFQDLADKKRVMAGGPWHFDNYVLVLEEPSEFGELSEMGFNLVEFWIQIHNVPMCCMSEEASKFLGEKIGKVVDVDDDGSGNRAGSFIRLRVVVDVRKPLKRFLKVDLTGNGDSRLLLIKYERLPDFCFKCGMLGHGERECLGGAAKEGTQSRQYGPWLRATSPPKRQTNRGRKEDVGVKPVPLLSGEVGLRKNNSSVSQEKHTTEVALPEVEASIPDREEFSGSTTGCSKMDVSDSRALEQMAVLPILAGTLILTKTDMTKEQSGKFPNYDGNSKDMQHGANKDLGLVSKNERVGIVDMGVSKAANKTKLQAVVVKKEMGTDTKAGGSKIEKDKILEDKMEQVLAEQVVEKESGTGQKSNMASGPNTKSKWKRQARNVHMAVDEVQITSVGSKRGPVQNMGLDSGAAKKLKGMVSEEILATNTTAGLEDSSASRSQ